MGTKFSVHSLLIIGKDLSYFPGVKISNRLSHRALQGFEENREYTGKNTEKITSISHESLIFLSKWSFLLKFDIKKRFFLRIRQHFLHIFSSVHLRLHWEDAKKI